jgi:hypothetical protein
MFIADRRREIGGLRPAGETLIRRRICGAWFPYVMVLFVPPTKDDARFSATFRPSTVAAGLLKYRSALIGGGVSQRHRAEEGGRAARFEVRSRHGDHG